VIRFWLLPNRLTAGRLVHCGWLNSGFPERFGSIEDSRAFGQTFFTWYDQEHHHSGIALLTPEMLHYGMAGLVIEQRQQVLDAAYARNPERFTNDRPKHPPQPTAVWINPPVPAIATERNLH